MWPKLLVSVGAIVFIAARFVWPDLKVDAITLGLVIVAILPWLSSMIESAKFPGGWEVKFRDVQSAAQKVIAEAPAGSLKMAESQAAYAYVADRDPNLAIVGLRIEIEKRIRALARKAGLSDERSMVRIFAQLRERGILQDASLSGLQELIVAGNQAAHGAKVEPAVASWALEYGPQVLATLDAKLREIDAG